MANLSDLPSNSNQAYFCALGQQWVENQSLEKSNNFLNFAKKIISIGDKILVRFSTEIWGEIWKNTKFWNIAKEFTKIIDSPTMIYEVEKYPTI